MTEKLGKLIEVHDFGCTCDDCTKDVEDDKND